MHCIQKGCRAIQDCLWKIMAIAILLPNIFTEAISSVSAREELALQQWNVTLNKCFIKCFFRRICFIQKVLSQWLREVPKISIYCQRLCTKPDFVHVWMVMQRLGIALCLDKPASNWSVVVLASHWMTGKIWLNQCGASGAMCSILKTAFLAT